jgi:tetratricopeptide (TPR) repeat protein
MPSVRNFWLLGTAAAVILCSFAAAAQQPGPAPDRAPRSEPPRAGEQRAGKLPFGKALPETAEGRAKLLSTLYAYLATAEDAQAARPIGELIERLWLQSGSDTVSLLMERALQAAHQKNLDLALKLMNAAVALAPDHAEAFNRRAYVHYLRNDYEAALGDLRRTLALEPNHYKALDGLSQLLRDLGEKKAALKAQRQLLDVHPFWPGGEETLRELEREAEGQGI